MKKFLSLVLSLLMIFSAMSASFVVAEAGKAENVPLIVVAGYSSTKLHYVNEKGEKVPAWEGIDLRIGDYLMENIAKIGMGLGAMTVGNAKIIAKAVGESFVKCYDVIAFDHKGESKYDLVPDRYTATECNSAVLDKEFPDGKYQHEKTIVESFSEYLDFTGSNDVQKSKDNVYNFTVDFRYGQIYCANRLYEFVNDVLKTTGAKKVNIFAVSHGGQTSATYMSMYCKKGDPHEGVVNKAVLTVPAIGGAGFAYDALSGDVDLDVKSIIKFVNYGNVHEVDAEWFAQAEATGFLNEIIKELLPYVYEIIGYWGSMWDFVPMDKYEELKNNSFINPKEATTLFAASDKYHKEIMPNYTKNLRNVEAQGTDIYIIAGYDRGCVTGYPLTTDGIIATEHATGATCTPLGKRFADGYVQKIKTGTYDVSPSMTVDASTEFLPNHTWYVEGLFHGMTYSDPKVRYLMKTLLFTDKIKDTTVNPEYPKFFTTTNPSEAVQAQFDSSLDGYLSSKDTKLIITNVSDTNKIKLVSVEALGVDLKFKGLFTKTLEPGEKIELEIKGDIPKVSLKSFDIIIDFVNLGTVTPVGEKRMNFTIMNGDPVPFDSKNPVIDANERTEFDDFTDSVTLTDILSKLGLRNILSIINNMIHEMYAVVRAVVKIIKNIQF